jgi:cell wall-associated NlpC family hydrolase
MKKIKTLAAFLLSLTLLTPLFACNKENLDTSSPQISSSEEVSVDSENTPDSSSENEEEDEPTMPTPTPIPTPTPTPPVSAPSAPSAPAPEPPAVSSKAQYIRCTGSNVNIRSGAGTSYSVLGSAEKGTNYIVLGQSGSWYKTYYKNQTAYVYASYTSVFTIEKSKDDETEDVIAEGYKLLGVPYVYGAVRFHNGKGKLLAGFSAQKFDCSSLIQYIFYKGAGVKLDVTTRTQIKQGKYVAKKDLQRGDCIFFTNEDRVNNTGIERVGHVALYLGDNYILHTASDYARIEQISQKRWSYYIEARRFL